MKRPDVILLNGTASAGKSSLTAALQAQLPFIRMGIDDFIWERAPTRWFGAPEGFIRELLDDWVAALHGIDVFFVGVHCAPEELVLRERARRDRVPGSAVSFIARVHAHRIYDLEVDSTATPSSALAALETRKGPSAFARLGRARVAPHRVPA